MKFTTSLFSIALSTSYLIATSNVSGVNAELVQHQQVFHENVIGESKNEVSFNFLRGGARNLKNNKNKNKNKNKDEDEPSIDDAFARPFRILPLGCLLLVSGDK